MERLRRIAQRQETDAYGNIHWRWRRPSPTVVGSVVIAAFLVGGGMAGAELKDRYFGPRREGETPSGLETPTPTPTEAAGTPRPPEPTPTLVFERPTATAEPGSTPTPTVEPEKTPVVVPTPTKKVEAVPAPTAVPTPEPTPTATRKPEPTPTAVVTPEPTVGDRFARAKNLIHLTEILENQGQEAWIKATGSKWDKIFIDPNNTQPLMQTVEDSDGKLHTVLAGILVQVTNLEVSFPAVVGMPWEAATDTNAVCIPGEQEKKSKICTNGTFSGTLGFYPDGSDRLDMVAAVESSRN